MKYAPGTESAIDVITMIGNTGTYLDSPFHRYAGGVHVVEHLTGLDAVPARGARFTAAPPAVRGFGTFLVRAFATFAAPH